MRTNLAAGRQVYRWDNPLQYGMWHDVYPSPQYGRPYCNLRFSSMSNGSSGNDPPSSDIRCKRLVEGMRLMDCGVWVFRYLRTTDLISSTSGTFIRGVWTKVNANGSAYHCGPSCPSNSQGQEYEPSRWFHRLRLCCHPQGRLASKSQTASEHREA